MKDFDYFQDQIKKIKNEQSNQKNSKKQVENFDKLLDEYNDTKLLYNLFGDEKYKRKMSLIKNKMKKNWESLYREDRDQK
jgi:hypothetical protein